MKGECFESDSIEGLKDYMVALVSLLSQKQARVQQLTARTVQLQKRIRSFKKLKVLAEEELSTALAGSTKVDSATEGCSALQTTYEHLETLLVGSKIRLAQLKSDQESLEDAIAGSKATVASKDLEIVHAQEKIDRVKAV